MGCREGCCTEGAPGWARASVKGHAERYPAAVEIEVDCYAGHRGEETPRRIVLGGRAVEVVEVVDRWYGPDHRYFKLLCSDGAVYLVRHDQVADRWELRLFER